MDIRKFMKRVCDIDTSQPVLRPSTSCSSSSTKDSENVEAESTGITLDNIYTEDVSNNRDKGNAKQQSKANESKKVGDVSIDAINNESDNAEESLTYVREKINIKEIPRDLGTDRPAQPSLRDYPGTLTGKKIRKFQKSWFTNRSWLEYSQERNACFCYACRKFGDETIRDHDPSFTIVGFTKWKFALESNKGFALHVRSKMHVNAMLRWRELECRTRTGQSIEHQLSKDQLARNRYYIKSVAEVIIFLALNELGFRGDNEQEKANVNDVRETNIGGLFLKLFEYTINKDEKLRSIAHSMPKNAKYTSPDIQNEVIDVLSSMVKRKIVDDYNKCDIGQCCLKCDETRDASNVEDMSVVLRFVSNGKPVEHLISMVQLTAVDAKSITKAIIDELHIHGIEPRTILSQCFDGASVMSGCKGGVQKLLQEQIGKTIPYIHCYNHRLHLVVVHSMQRDNKAKRFFSLCEQLYVFFRRQFPSAIYEGKTLKRLLEQRWTGHLESAKIVMDNRDDILETLEAASISEQVNGDLAVEAAGLHVNVLKPEFACMAAIVVRVLSLLQPANAMLQGKSCNMSVGIELIRASITSLTELRTEDTFIKMAEAAGFGNESDEPMPKRKRYQNTLFKDSVIMSTTGQSGVEGGTRQHSAKWRELLNAFYNIIDNVAGELSNRFGDISAGVADAVSVLVPSSVNFLQFKELQPLTVLLQQDKAEDISIVLRSELTVAAKFLRDKLPADCNLQQAVSCIFEYRDAFPTLYWHYAAALTLGISTATCENSFSCLTRILRPHRRSMTHTRKGNLVVLAFEKNITQSINIDEFLDIFASKTRRITL